MYDHFRVENNTFGRFQTPKSYVKNFETSLSVYTKMRKRHKITNKHVWLPIKKLLFQSTLSPDMCGQKAADQ